MPGLDARPVPADAPELHAALVEADLPTEDLLEGGRTFLRFEQAGDPVGYAGYELYGEDVLLRSIVVLPAMRGKGLGRALTASLLARAGEAGARRAFLLTTSAEDFFTRAGFTRIERREAPPAILATRQAASICTTAPLLTRAIEPEGTSHPFVRSTGVGDHATPGLDPGVVEGAFHSET
jgi:N-acetylglutamate synthase-like GNAT family acetyltransferase